MSLSFCVLGSGSAGNATLVICGEVHDTAQRKCFLIDCGLSPRATAKRIASLNLGLTLDDIGAIVLTHLDADHFYGGWLKVIAKRPPHNPLRVQVHRRHRHAAWHYGLTAREAELFNGTMHLDCGVTASTVLLAHDDVGSVGFVFEHDGVRLGYATDLGCVSAGLLEQFVNLNALAIESNYDRQMQLNSGRPAFLKRRIMGGSGHLSNAQALEAVFRVADSSNLSHIALLHLSRECNDPAVVRRLYQTEASELLRGLTITSQVEPSPLLAVDRTVDNGLRCTGAHRRLGIEQMPQLSLF